MTTSSLLARLYLIFVLVVGGASLCLTGCDSPARTIREIRQNIDDFRAAPSQASLDVIDRSFVKIDAVIKDFETKEDFAQADLFRRQALTLRYEYRAMREAYLKWKEDQARAGNSVE